MQNAQLSRAKLFFTPVLFCCQDQKVSWHATPFEERLLRVLSDEEPLHERYVAVLFFLFERRYVAVLITPFCTRWCPCVKDIFVVSVFTLGVMVPSRRKISEMLIHLEEKAE